MHFTLDQTGVPFLGHPVDKCIISIFLKLKPVTLLLIWNLQMATLPLTNLEKYLLSGSFLNLILKLVAPIIFVKYRASIIICHPIITEKLRFLHQKIEHTQANNFLSILCFHVSTAF